MALDTSINEPFYQWSVRAFSAVHKRVGMKINVHAENGEMEQGQIFLFNHFARFETLVPQYFIYQATGAYCRCVAAHELFESSERFARVLWGVGAVPNNHQGLLAFLAAEILRGRKVIFFPEGGMMKDRSMAAPPHEGLIDRFRLHSGHKQGASALAVVLELFKRRILSVEEAGETDRLDRWVKALGVEGRDALILAARRPTLVVPSNITFHPIHQGENFLLKAADFLKFDLGRRGREELMVEGNLILRKTDMDIRFGKPLNPNMSWSAADRLVLSRAFEQIDSLEDLFGLKDKADHWTGTLAASGVKRTVQRLRDRGMVEMYANVTLNISHLAARLMMRFASRGVSFVEKAKFHATLYAIVKSVQNEAGLHLHATLSNPNLYGFLPGQDSPALLSFYDTASKAGLIEISETHLTLWPSLLAEASDSDPRLANIVRVYANEISSLTGVLRIVESAEPMSGPELAEALFDDAKRAHRADLRASPGKLESIEFGVLADGPYLLKPEIVTGAGVVLVHDVLSSPTELRAFGERLAAAGHPVMGVRLRGHGTSPMDLRSCTSRDWLASVRQGFETMSHLSHEVLLVGSGTGASLALLLAVERPKKLAFVVAASAPVEFRSLSLRIPTMLNRLNALAFWARFQNGTVPVEVLRELRKVRDDLVSQLKEVYCPLLIVQGSDDPVVDPTSAKLIEDSVGSSEKALHLLASSQHDVLNDEASGTQDLILDRLAQFSALKPVTRPALKRLMPRLSANVAAVLSVVTRGNARVEQ